MRNRSKADHRLDIDRSRLQGRESDHVRVIIQISLRAKPVGTAAHDAFTHPKLQNVKSASQAAFIAELLPPLPQLHNLPLG
jgi:hypothetical protein